MSGTARSHVGAVLVAAFALVLGFAASSCGDKPKAPGCKGDKDCKDGLKCSDNKCVQCKADADCGDGKRCEANACVAAAECTKDDQCAAGQVCQAGKCKACATDTDCGPGGTCNAGACQKAKACAKDEDCADDEDCVNGFCKRAGTATTDPGACPLATVYFGFDDSGIQASERDRLDANAQCIEKTVGKPVFLTGHTDTSGTEEYNIALSERRAQSVADYLSRLGSDPARLQVVPKGETEPTGLGDDKDRRVEFQWHSIKGLLLSLTLSGCFWATTKSEGDALRKDVKSINDRLSAKEKALDDQVAALQKVLDESSKLLKRNSADLGADVDKMSGEMRTLNGLVVSLNNTINELKTAQAASTAKVDTLEQRLAQLESGKPSSNSSPDDLWRLGSTAFEAQRFNDAIDIFKRLVASYPTHDRADDAQYFRGQSYSNLKDWDKAIGAYQVLVDKFPDSTFTDDGLYFAALAAQNLKNCTEARAYLGVIKTKYPKSNVTKASTDLDAQIKKDAKNKAKCSS